MFYIDERPIPITTVTLFMMAHTMKNGIINEKKKKHSVTRCTLVCRFLDWALYYSVSYLPCYIYVSLSFVGSEGEST